VRERSAWHRESGKSEAPTRFRLKFPTAPGWAQDDAGAEHGEMHETKMAVHTRAVRTKLIIELWFFALAGLQRIFYRCCTRHVLAVSRLAPSLGFWRFTSKDKPGVIMRTTRHS
jgi:hypothetical protein